MSAVGRPTDYTPQLAQEICDVIANTTKGLNKLCRLNEHWPVRSTIHLWLLKHQEFSDLYAQAKDLQIELMSEETLEIADDGFNDTYTDEEGREKCDYDHIQRSKLRVDTRKWLLSKLKPKKYGDKVIHEPIESGSKSESEMSTDELRKELKYLKEIVEK